MLNKKIGLRSMLFVGAFFGATLSFVSAARFNIDLQTEVIQAINTGAIVENVIPVHFVDNGNNFGGFIYNSTGIDVDDGDDVLCIGNHCGEKVEFVGKNTYACKHRVRGFYYNSERGERLFPIDEETAAGWQNLNLQPGLTTEGGLYTECMSVELETVLSGCVNGVVEDESYDEGQCERDARDAYGFNGYYGMVTHQYSGKNFGLIVGAQYGEEDPWLVVSNSGFGETFIKYANKYPVGLLYDYHGGVGFVGCEFTGDNKTLGLRTIVNSLNAGSGLNEMFRETEDHTIEYSGDLNVALNCSGFDISESLIEIVIEGLVGMGKNSSELDVIGNQANPKMQFFKSVNVNNATLVNYAKKKAETLCRGKWINFNGWWKFYKDHLDGIPITINRNNWRTAYQSRRSYGGDRTMRKAWMNEQYKDWNSTFKYGGRLLCVNLENESEKTIVAEPGYTYIVKGGNVLVTPMNDLSDNNYYYDVYILGSGNLLLDNVTKIAKRVITKEGFIDYKCTETDCDPVVSDPEVAIGSYWDGVERASAGYSGNNVAVGAFIKGNFVVDGKIKHIGEIENIFANGDNHISNRYFVYGKLTTRDTIADLENLFSWYCSNGISSDSDEKYCPPSRSEWTNSYGNAPLVIIDQNYDSPVYNG